MLRLGDNLVLSAKSPFPNSCVNSNILFHMPQLNSDSHYRTDFHIFSFNRIVISSYTLYNNSNHYRLYQKQTSFPVYPYESIGKKRGPQYEEIAKFAKGEENKKILLRLAHEERAHYEIWKKYTDLEMKPEKGKIAY